MRPHETGAKQFKFSLVCRSINNSSLQQTVNKSRITESSLEVELLVSSVDFPTVIEKGVIQWCHPLKIAHLIFKCEVQIVSRCRLYNVMSLTAILSLLMFMLANQKLSWSKVKMKMFSRWLQAKSAWRVGPMKKIYSLEERYSFWGRICHWGPLKSQRWIIQIWSWKLNPVCGGFSNSWSLHHKRRLSLQAVFSCNQWWP